VVTTNTNPFRDFIVKDDALHRVLTRKPSSNADKPAQRESMQKIAPIRRENKLQTS